MPIDAQQPAVADAAVRREVLDPTRSFIVQAPAGSGKTELLIQRYLTLLARVDEPESIVAITFTRKAASEMSVRVLDALAKARRGDPPESPHQRETLRLAAQVLAQDQKRGWNLLENPSRARIQTIDSLCGAIVQRMPWMSRMGGMPEIVEDATELYRDAARQTLELIDSDTPYAAPARALARHLDNRLDKAREMVAALLGRRDQWLRLVGVFGDGIDTDQLRVSLEQNLEWIVRSHLRRLRQAVPRAIAGNLIRLASYAAGNVLSEGGDPEIGACFNLRQLPGTELGDLEAWKGLAKLLLTGQNEWRKRPNKNQGFPPKTTEKEEITSLLQSLEDEVEFRQLLGDLRQLPPARYSTEQWDVLQSFLRLMPVAVAQLKIVFQQEDLVDFTEISQAASQALGSTQEPTDLGLAFGCNIEHLLIDEFQDTSVSQMELLRRLIGVWEPGEGRTLFAVGDPMQSIYRFRQAEVGLFLEVRRNGMGMIPIEPKTLSVNFRSQEALVVWANTTFRSVFPAEEDIAEGAVPFSEAEPHLAAESNPSVKLHALVEETPEREAQLVADAVDDARRRRPGARIAILVRARPHLTHIVEELKSRNLRFRAVDIDPLQTRPEVLDLLALTRSLLHPADRTAWLATLRAPWCGLSLADLYTIAGNDLQSPVWELIGEPATALSPESAERLERYRQAMELALAMRGKATVRRMVEAAWLSLGGPSCLESDTAVENANRFFQILDEHEDGGDIADLDALDAAMKNLYAEPDVEADGALEILTVYKAKGLEWDVVIVPGIHRSPRSDEGKLIGWSEIPTEGPSRLIVAPIAAAGREKDPIHEYLKSLEMQKAGHETARLLYVAATRARKELHLFGTAKVAERNDGPELRRPNAHSFLARLWPVVGAEFQQSFSQWLSSRRAEAPSGGDEQRRERSILRLPAGYHLPEAPPPVEWKQRAAEEVDETARPISFEWVGETMRLVGVAVHAWLRRIASTGLQNWAPENLQARLPRFRAMLRDLGVPPEDLDAAAARVAVALERTVTDARGQWVLKLRTDAKNELALSYTTAGGFRKAVIDRTFVDEDGTRWIIDYKTSYHEGGGRERFLDEEQRRYRGQLENYARILGANNDKPIRLGLYFPLLGAWREWEALHQDASGLD